MIRTALASLFALALAGAAQAHSPVGGGSATISGGGDDMAITYSTGGGMALHSQSGRLARFAGSHGDGLWCTNRLMDVGRQLSPPFRRYAAIPACRAGSSG